MHHPSPSPSLYTQAFPPSPPVTSVHLPSLLSKTILITGSSTGIGLELAKLLFRAHATVYIHARTLSRANEGIAAVRAASPDSQGRLEALVCDLSDLGSVSRAAGGFVQREGRLHVLVNNAGVMRPPRGRRSVDGHDLELATNVLGPFLLTRLLSPLLQATAAEERLSNPHQQTVRVVWVSTILANGAPEGGFLFDEATGKPKTGLDSQKNYVMTKAASALLAAEFAERVREDGVLHVSCNPGLIKSELQRHLPAPVRGIMGVVFKPAIYGAYTELYCGFSPDLTAADSGCFFIPWGRKGEVPGHMQNSMKSEAQGGNGLRTHVYNWCESETQKFV